jgi:hypothetical protein
VIELKYSSACGFSWWGASSRLLWGRLLINQLFMISNRLQLLWFRAEQHLPTFSCWGFHIICIEFLLPFVPVDRSINHSVSRDIVAMWQLSSVPAYLCLYDPTAYSRNTSWAIFVHVFYGIQELQARESPNAVVARQSGTGPLDTVKLLATWQKQEFTSRITNALNCERSNLNTLPIACNNTISKPWVL